MSEVLVSGDRVTVRGEQSGTPAGDLFGVPPSGKSFSAYIVGVRSQAGREKER